MSSSRRWFGLSLAFLAACAAQNASAQDKPAPAGEPKPAVDAKPAAAPAPAAAVEPSRLEVGQAAPALSIEHWVKGEPVKTFEKGHVYVVEFWATWCGPCIQGIPHLTKLQKDYKDKGVTIIGVSGQDRRGVEDVRPFVEKKGDKMNYTVAVDKEMGTTRAYMMATGRGGIPCAYVVDKQGKLAWYGHPMEGMDLVIADVVEGKFDNAKHTERMNKFRQSSEEFGKSAQAKDWTAAEKALDDMKSVRPDLADDFEITRYAISRVGKKDRETINALLSRLETRFKDDLDNTRKLSEMLVSLPEPEEPDAAAAVALAQKVVDKTESRDAQAMAVLARAYQIKGDWDKAISTQQKAIEVADEEGMKMSLKGMLNQMEEDRKAEQAKPDAPKTDALPADAPKSDK